MSTFQFAEPTRPAVSSFAHIINDTNQRLLYYNLATSAEKQWSSYRQIFHFLVIGVSLLCCYAIYRFFQYKDTVPIANPHRELQHLSVLDAMRTKYHEMRKESWNKTRTLPGTVFVRSSGEPDEPVPVSMRQLQHDGSQRKEHRRQRRGSFARGGGGGNG